VPLAPNGCAVRACSQLCRRRASASAPRAAQRAEAAQQRDAADDDAILPIADFFFIIAIISPCHLLLPLLSFRLHVAAITLSAAISADAVLRFLSLFSFLSRCHAAAADATPLIAIFMTPLITLD